MTSEGKFRRLASESKRIKGTENLNHYTNSKSYNPGAMRSFVAAQNILVLCAPFYKNDPTIRNGDPYRTLNFSQTHSTLASLIRV